MNSRLQTTKSQLRSLRSGDVVTAQVEEVLSADAFIASFAGDLLRLKNETQRNLRAFETIKLIVTSVDPLAFQLAK